MGLTKQYLRYVPAALFGITASTKCNIVFVDIHGATGKMCAVGACESVIIWDLRKGEKQAELQGGKSEVTRLAASPDKRYLAVGYNDGAISIFDVYSGELKVTFSGHKSAISALNYHPSGMTLVSGSKDTEVVIWDVVAESGLYRLRGHKGMITQARFLQQSNILITSSKDSFVKCWDLDTQHCFSTIVGHKTEVWDFVVTPDEKKLVTGSADMELRVWQLSEQSALEPADKKVKRENTEEGGELDDDEDDSQQNMRYKLVGSIIRQGRDRVVCMELEPSGQYFACHGTDSLLEVFKFASEEDIQKLLKKREKKVKRKAREMEGGDGEAGAVTRSVSDEVRRLTTTRLSHKMRAFDLRLESSSKLKVVALLTNNSLESCQLDVNGKKTEAEAVSKLTSASHRTDVRTVCFSSDNTAILSASGESVKIWNRASKHCIRTMACEYALCSLFVPGDRHVIVGSKSGHLQLFDLGASELMQSLEAHSAAVWSVCMAPDKKSIVSGGADHEVKFWDFELMSSEQQAQSSKQLTLVHTKTLKMSEEVLCVRYSPDQRLIAVSLLDNTVKVFFVDTLKFFLSLYGHKLPVLSMDISYDSMLIVTASSDRNVKIWGLDFGDCHRSIFAHDDSVMGVQFVPKTHHFFTAGKDGKIKQWDADNFEHILTLEGHSAEVWCLGVSSSGNFVVSASHDRSLRLWEKTDEPIVLEEEHEMAREAEHDKAAVQSGDTVIPGETNTETGIASKKTVESVVGAERIMEAIDLHREHSETKPSSVPPLFQAYGVTTSDRYVLEVLARIKSSELDESLLILPFSYVADLLTLLAVFLDNSWQEELSCRCLFFLLRVHHGQITTSQTLLPTIDRLRHLAVSRVKHLKDTLGVNLAGLRHLQAKVEQRDEVALFVDATGQFKEKRKRSKKRAILTVQ